MTFPGVYRNSIENMMHIKSSEYQSFTAHVHDTCTCKNVPRNVTMRITGFPPEFTFAYTDYSFYKKKQEQQEEIRATKHPQPQLTKTENGRKL